MSIEPGNGIAKIVDTSLAVRSVERILSGVQQAAGSSQSAGYVTGLMAGWRRTPPRVQRFAAGVALLIAVTVHVALMAANRTPVGFYWLLVPGMAAAAGILLLLASAFWQNGERSR
jgi:hypothetical protein